jgi:hypothetical protein
VHLVFVGSAVALAFVDKGHVTPDH